MRKLKCPGYLLAPLAAALLCAVGLAGCINFTTPASVALVHKDKVESIYQPEDGTPPSYGAPFGPVAFQGVKTYTSLAKDTTLTDYTGQTATLTDNTLTIQGTTYNNISEYVGGKITYFGGAITAGDWAYLCQGTGDNPTKIGVVLHVAILTINYTTIILGKTHVSNPVSMKNFKDYSMPVDYSDMPDTIKWQGAYNVGTHDNTEPNNPYA
jgi:hypothetical protein